MQARYAELAARTGATFPASAKAGGLSVANKQLIEIMRAVQARHSVLIMDEPTAPLGPAERGRLVRSGRPAAGGRHRDHLHFP